MILLIDDDWFGMKPYRLALEMEGFTVENARDPDEALHILNKRAAEVDLIILDVMMPSGSIFEQEDVEQGLTTGKVLLGVLREKFPHIPIVVFSITNVEALGTKLEGGGVEFLSKADTLPSELVDVAKAQYG